MIPRLLIDTAPVPGGGELRLIKRGEDYAIMLGANELMSSRLSGSEEALATLACAKMGGHASPRILIGGLGMGFTLRAALAALGPDAEVVVAELLPAVIGWAHGPLRHLFGDSLADPRVRLVEADVGDLIDVARAEHDAILLDVDNGPDGLSRDANDRLYGDAGIKRAWSALRPAGLFAIWSATPHKAFAQRLRAAGFDVEEVAVRGGRARKGARHIIWIAAKPA